MLNKKKAKEQKPIKAKRCKYMPAVANTVIIFSTKHGDVYQAGFTIGNQDFTVAERETKDEAQWHCDMLEIAFKALIHNPLEDTFKGPIGKAAVRDMAEPKIQVINKR